MCCFCYARNIQKLERYYWIIIMNVLRKGLGKLWYEMSDKQCSIYFEFTEILWLQGWDISSCPPPQQLLLQISSYGWEVVFFSSFPMHFQFLTILPIPAVVNLGVSIDKYFLENVFKVYESIVSPHPRITWFQANIVYSDGWGGNKLTLQINLWMK